MKFVTGNCGFIGRNLLAKLDGQVACYDTLTNTLPDIFMILDAIEWENVDEIYHLGAISDTTCKDINLLHAHNVDFSIRLFEKAIDYQIPVTYASSGSVYGNTCEGKQYRINPLNYYAMTKATVDAWVEDNMSRFKLVRGMRFFNVYGDNEGSKGEQASPYYKFMQQANETRVIKIFDNSDSAHRDFIHVNSVVKTILECKKESGIYDVGTAAPKSFTEVAESIASRTGARIERIKFPLKLQGKYQYFTSAQYNYNDLIK